MKPRLFEAAALAIALGIISYQLLMPPLVGLADSGDFNRFLQQNGLARISTEFEDYFFYFDSKYRIIPVSVTDEMEGQLAIVSSTSLPIRAARLISIAAGQKEFFDIRFLAALYMLLLLFGIWLTLVSMRPLSMIARIIGGGGAHRHLYRCWLCFIL